MGPVAPIRGKGAILGSKHLPSSGVESKHPFLQLDNIGGIRPLSFSPPCKCFLFLFVGKGKISGLPVLKDTGAVLMEAQLLGFHRWESCPSPCPHIPRSHQNDRGGSRVGPARSRLGADIPHTPENTDFYELFISGLVHPRAVPPSHLELQA